MPERLVSLERPFEGTKVYFSGSIRGVAEADPHFAWNLVQFMGKGGATVLSEHVAARSFEERVAIEAVNTGKTIDEILERHEPWFDVRRQDMQWVDEATHVVALVNSPSHGVGMEVERAILKPERGLNVTPILALIHSDIFERLSHMVRGVRKDEAMFYLRSYKDLKEAQAHIEDFL